MSEIKFSEGIPERRDQFSRIIYPEEVLDKMFELLDTYQFVSVADLYDLVGVTGNYTDNKYGWTNLRGAEPVRMRDGGYALKLPKAYPIDQEVIYVRM